MEEQKNMQPEEKLPEAQKVKLFDTLDIICFVICTISIFANVLTGGAGFFPNLIGTVAGITLGVRFFKRKGHMNHLHKTDK